MKYLIKELTDNVLIGDKTQILEAAHIVDLDALLEEENMFHAQTTTQNIVNGKMIRTYIGYSAAVDEPEITDGHYTVFTAEVYTETLTKREFGITELLMELDGARFRKLEESDPFAGASADAVITESDEHIMIIDASDVFEGEAKIEVYKIVDDEPSAEPVIFRIQKA